jgi:hypothetical protein
MKKEDEKPFWRRWIEADEVERLKLVRTLPCFQRGGICRYMTATLMNSYLKDLYKEAKKESEGCIDPSTGRMT